MADIEGEVITDEPETALVKASDSSHQVEIFNPLDAEPVAFKKALESRSENYDALALHLRGILVPEKDFGRIHHANKEKCPEPRHCSYEQNPHHYSDYRLLKPGGDKVLGLLGLGVSYPDEEDYRRATLRGLPITDVVIKCYIDNGRGQILCEGMGAASRDKEKGDLNNTIKKACKRARLDAVDRLPAISALFETDFLEQIAREAKRKNSTTSRQQTVNPKHDTGALLQVFPLKGNLAGERFDQMDDGAIDWCIRTFEASKPDIYKAALRVRESRQNPPTDPEPAEDPTPRPLKQETGKTADFLAEYDREQAFENSRE